MSTPGVKVGVSEEEKKLSYYKYYEQDLAPVPAEKIAILQGRTNRTGKMHPV